MDQFWKWLQTSFLANLRARTWYNNDIAENLTDYIDDKSNRIIGWAIMRQLRIRQSLSLRNPSIAFLFSFIDSLCKIPSIIRRLVDSCEDDYSLFDEDQRSYAPNWQNLTNQSDLSAMANAFIYRTSRELDSYVYVGDHGTYGSGGYVYEFRGDGENFHDDMIVLRQSSWIDDRSRAVMIQLNLYNPNVDFYTSVTLLAEITNIGEVFPRTSFEPIQMYTSFNNFSSIFYLIIALIYMGFITSMIGFEIRSIIRMKKRYFRQLHCYIEWTIIILSWSGVGVYIWRYHEARRIGKHFHENNASQYINLQFATYVNDILTFLLGFCCFFGTIRSLRLFHRYPRVDIFAQTLKRSLNEMVAFSGMFFLLFFAFVVLFYLLFVSKIYSCSSLLLTSGMLFEMLLLKFDFTDIQNADAFLGPFVFVLFIYFVVFVCTTMFTTIVIENSRIVREENHRIGEHYPGMIRFVLRDFAKRVGWTKVTEDDLQEQYDMIMREKYKDPVEQLPEKVDELFVALSKVRLRDNLLIFILFIEDLSYFGHDECDFREESLDFIAVKWSIEKKSNDKTNNLFEIRDLMCEGFFFLLHSIE